MKLILHIGTEKTGTTSLQKWMGVNRDAVRRQQVLYPHSLGEDRHIFASIYAADYENGDNIAYHLNKITSAADLEHFREQTRAALQAEVNEAALAGVETCFISDEGLQAVLRNPAEVARLHELFEGLFSSIEVVVLLRSQLDYAVSLASTFSRLGFTVNLGWFLSIASEGGRYDYDRLVAMWEEAFGAENIRLIAYNQAPRSIPAFQELLGISDSPDFQSVPRENSFVDWRYIRIVNQLEGAQRHSFRATLDRLPHSQKVRPGRAFVAAFNAKFLESNRRLVERHPEIALADLMADPQDYDEVGNLGALDKPLEGAGLILDIVKKLL